MTTPMFSALPDRLMYWADFASREPTPTIGTIAMMGWLLVDNPYETRIYRNAVRAVRAIIAQGLSERYLEFVYGSSPASNTDVVLWREPNDADEDWIEFHPNGEILTGLTLDKN